tara:strand:- start:15124 stop:16128 length:1005 start_codon:yes stop_codon:yes gene_type:complete
MNLHRTVYIVATLALLTTQPSCSDTNEASVAADADTQAESETTVLATGQGYPTSIALSASHVYWANQVGGTIMRAPLGGGEAEVLASGQQTPVDVKINETHVFWANSTSIASVPLAGGAPTILAEVEETPGLRALDAIALSDTSLYFSHAATGSINEVPLQGGDPRVFVDGQEGPGDLAVANGEVYWINRVVSSTSVGRSSIARMSTTGGSPQTVVGELKAPWYLSVVQDDILFTDLGADPRLPRGQVMRVAIVGGSAEVLADGQEAPSAVVGDDEGRVYWANLDAGSICQVESEPAEKQEIAEGYGDIYALAFDDNYIVWASANQGTILRQAR